MPHWDVHNANGVFFLVIRYTDKIGYKIEHCGGAAGWPPFVLDGFPPYCTLPSEGYISRFCASLHPSPYLIPSIHPSIYLTYTIDRTRTLLLCWLTTNSNQQPTYRAVNSIVYHLQPIYLSSPHEQRSNIYPTRQHYCTIG